ncbi:hypothetical protein Syun_007465 [Stephania yunnanensis]|uniref:Myb/SANT-like domain-containing protein n=1 Tax=Stephania yunnanensis TaxID=152371 RepID=A0AAP0Q0A9_9MAGN
MRFYDALHEQVGKETKVGRCKWNHVEDASIIHGMFEMVGYGVDKCDNVFKPGYLNHLEEALKITCPTSTIKAKPHIEYRVKKLKEWDVFNDIIYGIKHDSSGFSFDSNSNMVTTPDDATGEDAIALEDALEDVEDVANDSSNNSNYGNGNPSKKKKVTGDMYSWDQMLAVTYVMVSEIAKVSNAINTEHNMSNDVVAARGKVVELFDVEKAVYGSKIMGRMDYMAAFPSLKAELRLRRSLSAGSLLPFDRKIEKTCHRNSKVTRQRNQSSRVQLNDKQPLLMADHIGNPHAPNAPIAPHEKREEPLVIPPQQFVAPAGPHAPVEQQRPVVHKHQPFDQ